MNKKILIGCYEIPGFGGANTASYELFEALQSDGLDVDYLNIINERDVDYFRCVFGENYGNPKGLKNVHNGILKGYLFSPHPELKSLINNISPGILIGKGHIAALLMKEAAPEKDLIFMTSWCDQVKEYMTRGLAKNASSFAESIPNAKYAPVVVGKREKEIVENADLIIAHSDMIKCFYDYFYPSSVGKIYPDTIWSAEWIYKAALSYSGLKKPFSDRDIDLLFVSSIWTRPEKNYALVEKIISKRRNLNIHIVGEAAKIHPGAQYHGLLTRREDVFSLLGRTRTVVCPSLYDAAPGLLFEASAMGCNIIASKNCGNWMICNERLLADRFVLDDFLERIDISVRQKYDDNIDYFMRSGSYKNLVEVILALQSGSQYTGNNLMNDVTAVVLTVGEETTKRAIESLKNQTIPPAETLVIENVVPFHKAVNVAASKVKTDYFAQVDSDMILDRDCLEKLRNCMSQNVGVAVGLLRDELMGRVPGVKMFRTACFNDAKFRDVISPDTDFLDEISGYGYTNVYALKYTGEGGMSLHALGEHKPAYTFNAVYTVYSLRGRRCNLAGLLWLLERLRSSGHAFSLVAQVAVAHGLFLKKDRDLLAPVSRDEDAITLENFLKSNNDYPVGNPAFSLFFSVKPLVVFRKFYELGSMLKKHNAFPAFKSCLNSLNECGDVLAWIAIVALCHGIFSEEFIKEKADAEYRELEKLSYKYTSFLIIKKRLKGILSKRK